MKAIRIGTRGSKLALWQARHILQLIKEKFPERPAEIKIIKTEGDRDQLSSLTKIGGQGVFTKTIEDALIAEKIDLAVHSLKDLPSTLADGLILGAVPMRAAVEDIMITRSKTSFADLAQEAKIATGSIRRRSQLLHLQPDLQMVDLRGNIETRLKKLSSGNFDGLIMAAAAIKRLQISGLNTYTFPVDQIMPAVGQGAIGIEIRENEDDLQQLLAAINHRDTFLAVSAERALLKTLDSGCQFPVGAYARVMEDVLQLSGFVGSEDGSEKLVIHHKGKKNEAESIGIKVAQDLLRIGARTLLKSYHEKNS